LIEISERLVDRSTCIGSRWRRRIAGTLRRALEIEAIDPREKSDVGIDEELPVLGTTAPRQRFGQRVTGNARARDCFAGHMLVDHSVFRKIFDRPSLFRSKSLLVTKIMKNLPRTSRLEHDAVQADHALDGFLPAFRSGANPGNSGHVAFGIRSVAAAAFAYD
jgi:hypothetical protein